MIVLGIDPGIARLGYGVLEVGRGKDPHLVTYGCIETPKELAKELRFVMIADQLKTIIAHYKPAAVGVERLYFSTNVKTALTVGEARGVVLLVIAQAKVPIIEVDPGEVKLALTGYGRADKAQMQQMVKRVFKLSEIPKPDDAADALAIAYTASLKPMP